MPLVYKSDLPLVHKSDMPLVNKSDCPLYITCVRNNNTNFNSLFSRQFIFHTKINVLRHAGK